MLKIAPFPQKTAQTHISYLKTVSNCPNEAPAPPSNHACSELYSAVQTLTNFTVPTAPNELDSAAQPAANMTVPTAPTHMTMLHSLHHMNH